MHVARERSLRHRKAAPAQSAPQLVLVLDRRRSHQVPYRIVTFRLHRFGLTINDP
jgi:hypothetical protein